MILAPWMVAIDNAANWITLCFIGLRHTLFGHPTKSRRCFIFAGSRTAI
jgi:hypothetical protein